MHYVEHAVETRNPSKAFHNTSTVSVPGREPELSRGGSVIKFRRPNWSSSLCNAVAGIAGIGQEGHHVG